MSTEQRLLVAKLMLGAFTVGVLVVLGYGGLNQVSSSLTGQPTEYRMADGVRCYYSQSGSLSCIQVK